MAFTESSIAKAKREFIGKNKIIFGGTNLGLALHIGVGGTTTWFLHYRIDGRARKHKLGVYPWVGIAEAQRLALDAKQLIEQGIDVDAKKKEDAKQAEIAGITFREQAEKWFTDRYANKKPRTIESVREILDRDILPWIGDQPIVNLESADLFDCIERVLNRGARQAASRMKGYFNQIFKRAISRRIVKHNIAADLESISLPKARHVSAIVNPIDVGGLVRAIRKYEGTFVVKCALELAPLVFLRPIELRFARWSEFNVEEKTWEIQADRMKMKRDHIVPLSKQAISILSELNCLTGNGELVFPQRNHKSTPIGKNTLNGALERLDLKGVMTSHGFRSTASTLLRKLGYSDKIIEKQLSHEKSDVEHAYNRYEYLDERREMMQAWADYLDQLATGGKILTFPRKLRTRLFGH